MNIYLWLIYIIIGIISLLPITRIDLFSVSKKYTYFKYLSIFLFIWTILLGLRFVIDNSFTFYYLTLSVYPLLFIITSLTFMAIMTYLEKPVPEFLKYIFLVFLLVELVISYTNNFHGLMLEIYLENSLTKEQILSSNPGTFFYIHIVVCYLLLLVSLYLISSRFFKKMVEDEDYFPFIILVIGIIVGIVVNILHVFFFNFVLDPTYLAYILFTSILYYIFYIRDVRLIIKMNNNSFILNNLREMYLIVDQNGIVIDASKAMLEKLSYKVVENISFSELIDKLKKQAIIYEKGSELDDEYNPNKDYLHMQKKPIEIPFFKYSGYFYMFYDETKIQKYINDINYARNHDLMTELYNRNFFEDLRDKLEEEKNYAFIMFDLDGLKLFNDYLGHKAGDKLLTRFADKLKKLASDEKITPIRMGGDEFLLIVKEATKEKVNKIIVKLQSMTKAEDELKSIGFSYGYALSSKDKSTSYTLSKADEKLYKMKNERSKAKEELEELLKKRTNK
ncbi:MAG: diguanylate cyclase domain-containing protein [Bacillota bacterium]